MNIKNVNNLETRIFQGSVTIEKRDGEGSDGKRFIRGYAAVFDKLSENLGGFREKIKAGAFDDVIGDDVRALFNHDSNWILGRSTAKTLTISIDEEGLHYEIDPPDTQAARDLMVSIDRGDVRESSFSFIVDDDDWEEDDEGRITRTITKFKRLLDVSPVTFAAYPDASTALRSMEQWKEQRSPVAAPPEYLHTLRKQRLRIEEVSG